MSSLFEPTLDRMHRYRRAVAASSRVTWWLGRTFPRAFPFVTVSGFPKSGTVWVTQLVADSLRLPFPQISVLPVGCAAVLHGHEPMSPKQGPGVYVLRDGRDAMVSLYFHLARRVPEGDRPTLTRQQRRQFPGLVNKANVRDNLPAFLEAQFAKPYATHGLTWADHARRYFDVRPDRCPMVRYEDLLADPEPTLAGVLAGMTGEEPDARQVAITVERYSFAARTGRKRGQEDRADFLRKGQRGDWVNHFTPAAEQIFADHCGDVLAEAGYLADDEAAIAA